MKIGFVSLGCSKNLVDTEVMLKILADAGHEITPDETVADIIVVNTCGFIQSAKEEAIENILDVAWLKKNRSLRGIIATGCLAERYREQILTEMPEVDAVLGTGSYHKIAEAVAAVAKGEKYTSFEDKEKAPLGGERVLTTPEYTAYLKVAEGCDNRCTYCAIPLIRGGMRSRTMEDIVSEAKELEALGVKELNLIAQDTSRYGLDIYGEYKLHELIQKICAETKLLWIRLLYLYPDKITDELIAEMRDNPRVIKYADIPVQHISDKVLKRMNRHGDGATIRDCIARLRREIPDVTLRSTAIVGFPGETEEDFAELCEFVKEAQFDRFGAFTYSVEEGTAAAEFDDQIDEQTKQDRYDVLMSVQLAVSEKKLEKMIGKKIEVLCEGFDTVAGVHFGRSRADAPDVDGKVYFTAPKKIRAGRFVEVEITEAMDYDLFGEMVSTR
ncbi:MAG: 30S ribosomal protein S12 methylthiotransferase RimO [Clostridia bacterium]|nr:30S ribosomal protein S12 methylthiotransferase RimO [Clostridia bacterium]